MSQDDLTPFWRLQWASAKIMREWQTTGVPILTMKRLESIVNEARKSGFEAGELQGRANLRKDIEGGVVQPIELIPREGNRD